MGMLLYYYYRYESMYVLCMNQLLNGNVSMYNNNNTKTNQFNSMGMLLYYYYRYESMYVLCMNQLLNGNVSMYNNNNTKTNQCQFNGDVIVLLL